MDYALLLSSFDREHGHRSWPRQRLLHECLRWAIRDGTLAPGTRLVATRTLAADLGVARNTVLYAYEQLASEGFVVPDKRGTVVATLATGTPRRKAAPVPQAGLARRAQNLRHVSNGASDGLPFVPGVPDLASFPLVLWRRLLDRAWRGLSPAQLNYSDPAGEPVLRAAIADHLRAARGVVCEAHQVFITDGSQSTLDLCARACADEGDTVWIENPGYGGALAAFRAAGLVIEGIPVDEEGMAPAAQDWRTRRPRLIYATPSHQYPVGTVLSLARRMALIDGARACGALIVEDDYDSEFRHDGPPLAAMQGLAPDSPVLYCGTFSKTMFPRRWRRCGPSRRRPGAWPSSWRWPNSCAAASSRCTCGACAGCTGSAATPWWRRWTGTWAASPPCTAPRPACTCRCVSPTPRCPTWPSSSGRARKASSSTRCRRTRYRGRQDGTG